EVEGLENEAEDLGAGGGEAVEGEGGDVGAVDDDASGVRLVDAADQIEQRGFTAAGGAGEGEKIAPGDVEADVHQRRNVDTAEAVRLADTLELDDWLCFHAGLLR